MSHPKEKKKKLGGASKIINIVLILSITAALIWGVRVYFKLDKSQYTNDAQIEEYISPINARVGGYIEKIYFIEHQSVKKGDTLAVIWDKELKIAEEQAEAAYLNAMAARSLSSSSVNTVRNSVSIANSNADAVKARLLNAQKNLQRYASLLKDEVVTQQQYEQVQTEYDALKAQYNGLKGMSQGSELSTLEAGKKILINEAEIKRTKAALDMARLNLSYAVIKAPYDGVVGRRTLQEGQLVQPGQSIVSIVRGAQKWIVANYRETQISQLKPGQLMSIKADAFGGKVFKGKITAISQATGAKFSAVPVDNSTGNFVKVQQRIPVRIEFTSDNDQKELDLLRAGMNVEIESI